jgi:hypothetical protein
MSKTIIFVALVFLLAGCVSTQKLDQEFYIGIEQGAKEYTDALGNIATLIGMYEGGSVMLQSTEWKESILGAANTILGKANQLYSITDSYCPRDEKILCKDIEALYLKTRDMNGSLQVAVKGDSNSQMQAAIDKFDDLLAHLESMSAGQ